MHQNIHCSTATNKHIAGVDMWSHQVIPCDLVLANFFSLRCEPWTDLNEFSDFDQSNIHTPL